jgi:nicotinamide-nucleotide amidase
MGLKYSSGADCCVAVTGIAGPDGGTDDKPVGLVYIGVFYKNKLEVTRWHFKGERQVVQDKTAIKAFNLIRKAID